MCWNISLMPMPYFTSLSICRVNTESDAFFHSYAYIANNLPCALKKEGQLQRPCCCNRCLMEHSCCSRISAAISLGSVLGLPESDKPQSSGCCAIRVWRKEGVRCKGGWLKIPSDSLKLFPGAGAGCALPCPAGCGHNMASLGQCRICTPP